MQIKTYDALELFELLKSEDFSKMQIVPISTHRADSHILNPRQQKGDVLMIIAYEGADMVGYLGVFADDIYNTKRDKFHCGWLSCMWVNPALRGQGIAKRLLQTAFEKWNNHILVTEFTPEAKALYDRSANFTHLRTNEGLRCYMRSCLHEVLPMKNEKLKPFVKLLKAIDTVANMPVEWLQTFRFKKLETTLLFELISEVDEALNDFILTKQTTSFECRAALEFDWIKRNPWLIVSAPTAESAKYHFSSVANSFENRTLKILDGKTIKGYLHITIRDGHIKVPYAYYDADIVDDISRYLYQTAYIERATLLTVFNQRIVTSLKQLPLPFIYKRPMKRNYIITKALDEHFDDKELLDIQDGDADAVFT